MNSPRLRIAFAGTPEFAAISLKSLIKADQHDLVAVFTQPDRPAGRGRKIQKSAVKELAESNNLDALQPVSFKDQATLETLQSLDLDLLIVVAYGQILPQAILDTPRLGCINVHGSLLPRWRGAAPIQRAIEAGDPESGVTIMQMAAGTDTGPMYLKAACSIENKDTAQVLHDKLAVLGAEALLETITALSSGSARLENQDESLVTYAAKITKEEAAINWQESAIEIQRKVCAFNPAPVCHTELFEKKVRVWEAEVIDSHTISKTDKPAGEIVKASHEGIDIATGEQLLRIKVLQMPGKRQIAVADFVNGNKDLLAEYYEK